MSFLIKASCLNNKQMGNTSNAIIESKEQKCLKSLKISSRDIQTNFIDLISDLRINSHIQYVSLTNDVSIFRLPSTIAQWNPPENFSSITIYNQGCDDLEIFVGYEKLTTLSQKSKITLEVIKHSISLRWD
jgi:hypothetical protein